MAQDPLITSFFDQLGDHVADYGEGHDERQRKRPGRRRKQKDGQPEVDPASGTQVIPDGENRVGAVRIEKHLPFLKELLTFVLNNKPGGWITPQEGVQVFLPETFAPVFKLQQGSWSLDLAQSAIKLQIRKKILGMTISYPTALQGIKVTAAGIAVALDNCPDLLVSHVE